MSNEQFSHVRKGYISYLRVSTKAQGVSGLGLEAQRQTVQRYIESQHGTLLHEYLEVESGRKKDRPELQKAVRHAKATGSVLIIARLDRLARNVAFTASLLDSGVDFHACDLPGANKLTVHLMAALAEQEAALISARTKAALAVARQRGVKLGNPNIRQLQGDQQAANRAKRKKAQDRAESYREIVRELLALGVDTQTGLAGALNARNYLTDRQCRWTATSVGRLLDRLEVSLL